MKPYLKQHSGVLKTEGIFMLILGVIAILLPVITTFAITLLIGALLFVGGVTTRTQFEDENQGCRSQIQMLC